jgi:hypothetical protein
VADDTILLEDAIFDTIGNALGAEEFIIGAAAQDANDRIIYNDATGAPNISATRRQPHRRHRRRLFN